MEYIMQIQIYEQRHWNSQKKTVEYPVATYNAI
jgi:hypothetical protein